MTEQQVAGLMLLALGAVAIPVVILSFYYAIPGKRAWRMRNRILKAVYGKDY